MLSPLAQASQAMDHGLGAGALGHPRRKRKAELQDGNERLSKRLSLLNLEHNGPKLYVPVENPQAASPSLISPASLSSNINGASKTNAPVTPSPPSASSSAPPPPDVAGVVQDESMQLDDTKYKVYIYNLDDELSESEPEDAEGKLVFLPDIEKHLRSMRAGGPPSSALPVPLPPPPIPRPILPNKDGELAGMQMVLYSEPSSLSIPQSRDSVRKAIIEARARARQKSIDSSSPPSAHGAPPSLPPLLNATRNDSIPATDVQQDDPDAMEID